MALEKHRSDAPRQIATYVVTLSDSRKEHNDTSGASVREMLQHAGHAVVGWCILREDATTLERELEGLLHQGEPEVFVLTGGTGIAPRDLAYDVLARLYERPIPGFGELFRVLSHAEIGSAAMLSRASAGVAHGKLVFSIPGSGGAVRLAMQELILPELGHMVGELRRATDTGDEH